ncbi:T9SS type B sorting domain-containing protein [Flagellimonas hymeniacidonis]|uniref:T9SS type B sorting domain-containing protein n=1 Tax=Flagellimonas hymeniacidonis TaxID=2603628 RepID=A0A5C8UZZ1_9FLAO|nr:T9SS type B sorting domain-containing protein [Flagellimonas hymeniacidonis]TXN35083.1 T9SS type B sorting domain-containing protein [Flagellimonas hymeniacidonis]
MLKKYHYLLLSCLFSLASFGQGETSNWYFGNGAGIRFNNDGTVTALDGGRLNTFEGCASISDTDGNLLLYTDGINVYGRDNNLIENGFKLYGDPSSTQSAIIVQKPNDPNILYIFTVDTSVFEGDPNRGLNYSVVDLSLNGGNGAVTQKNINLLRFCSEKVTAVLKNCLDKSIWVVTLGPENSNTGPFNTYHAFEVTSAGVNTTPVNSKFDDLEVLDSRGYMKFSPDGETLASANSASGLYLYDFDVDTGILSNQNQILVTAPNKFPYGIEFSPNQRFLYAHTSNNAPAAQVGGHSSSLLQYDLNASNISASEVEIDRRPIYRGALQLGQNGKIYRTIAENYLTGTPYLGVIENPNELGNAATYRHNAVFLNGQNATQGLPPFIQSFFDRIDLIKNADGSSSSSLTVCVGDQFTLEAENFPNATYNWEKDGNPLGISTNTLTINPAMFSDSGRYSLEVIFNDPGECPIIGEAFISVNPLPDAPSLFLAQCDVDTSSAIDGITNFNLEEASFNSNFSFTFYESLSDLGSNNPIPNPVGYSNTTPFNQTIYYKVIDQNGCENSGELELEIRSVILLPEDQQTYYACGDNPEDQIQEGVFDLESIRELNYPNLDIAFYTTLEDVSLEQNPVSGDYRTSSTTIYVRIEDSNECEDIDEINLIVNPTPALTFDSEIVWCTDGPPLPIEAPAGFDIYRWFKTTAASPIQVGNQQGLQISEIGNYVLEVGYRYNTNEGVFECFNEASFDVLPSNIAVIDDVLVEDISENNMVEITVSGDGDYEYSIDGFFYQDSPIFENILPGFITVYVRDKNGCGISKEVVSVIGYPKFFTPNGDGVNDSWQIIGINEQFQSESVISIYNRFGKLMALVSPKTQGWNGTFDNNELPASDYWFKVNLEDGRVFKGHFALKR